MLQLYYKTITERIMNLYEAIYARRSVRNYRMEPLDDTILKGIPDFLNEVEPLFPDIRTEIRIVDRRLLQCESALLCGTLFGIEGKK